MAQSSLGSLVHLLFRAVLMPLPVCTPASLKILTIFAGPTQKDPPSPGHSSLQAQALAANVTIAYGVVGNHTFGSAPKPSAGRELTFLAVSPSDMSYLSRPADQKIDTHLLIPGVPSLGQFSFFVPSTWRVMLTPD